MRREGSPWAGAATVFLKEFADHLASMRMRVLEWLVILTALGAVYASLQDIKATTSEDPFLFLHLFTHARSPLPSFVSLLGFLVPLVAIGLGFDAVNSEFNRRTISRVLAQPIYRDALLFGKFASGLATLAVSFAALWLLVFGLGLLLLGVPPSGEEVARALSFYVATVAYAGVWLAVALLFSVVFRSAATSAMCTIGLWLLFTVLWPVIVPFIVQAVSPNQAAAMLGVPDIHQIELRQALSRFSPNTLYLESVIALLQPATRALGPVFVSDLIGAVPGAPLHFGQSLLLVWPQLTALIASVIAIFAITYALFQRQEIRA
jgi:ABC-2 type transport system permease protein